jgi:hypothetical protein
MSRRLICDGCERILQPREVALHGQRGEGDPPPGPIPLLVRDFHLCSGCAVIGFLAIQQANLTRDV